MLYQNHVSDTIPVNRFSLELIGNTTPRPSQIIETASTHGLKTSPESLGKSQDSQVTVESAHHPPPIGATSASSNSSLETIDAVAGLRPILVKTLSPRGSDVSIDSSAQSRPHPTPLKSMSPRGSAKRLLIPSLPSIFESTTDADGNVSFRRLQSSDIQGQPHSTSSLAHTEAHNTVDARIEIDPTPMPSKSEQVDSAGAGQYTEIHISGEAPLGYTFDPVDYSNASINTTVNTTANSATTQETAHDLNEIVKRALSPQPVNTSTPRSLSDPIRVPSPSSPRLLAKKPSIIISVSRIVQIE